VSARPEPALPSVRPCVERISEYAGPEDPARLAARLGRPAESIVKLDANENPYGPSPLVAEALSQFAAYQIYPDSEQREDREILSDYLGVPSEHLMLGNGSDEIIDLLMRTFLDPGDEIMDFTPSFGMYSFNAQHQDARVVAVERDASFAIPIEQAIEALTPRTKLIFVTSPNNPTANVTAPSDVRRLLESGRIVVLDEAYAEFAAADGQGFQSMLGEVQHHPNLVVLRTFSKWAGLAGLRIGYGMFHEDLIQHLWKIKQPYNINVAAQAAALGSLEDVDYLMDKVRIVIGERERIYARLQSLPGLHVYPSQANFLLCRVLAGDAKAIKDELMRRGILVRYFNKPGLSDCIRFSIGTPEQNDVLLATLEEIVGMAARAV
jgi:histidinol-phosphate aminotransferase